MFDTVTVEKRFLDAFGVLKHSLNAVIPKRCFVNFLCDLTASAPSYPSALTIAILFLLVVKSECELSLARETGSLK